MNTYKDKYENNGEEKAKAETKIPDEFSKVIKDLIRDIKESACKAIRDVSHEDAEDCNKSTSSDKINWKSKKIWLLLLASPVVVEVIKSIPKLIGLFFGQGTAP